MQFDHPNGPQYFGKAFDRHFVFPRRVEDIPKIQAIDWKRPSDYESQDLLLAKNVSTSRGVLK